MSTVPFCQKEQYRMDDLVEIIRLLRSPQGCPWDKVQTHSSIRGCMTEEAYEVVDAIDKQDADMLCEELGDVLMQVVFHAGIEQDAGRFDFDDVCDGICKKMIYRHPHIFARTQGVDTADRVLEQWEALKEKEKSLHTARQDLAAIPKGLPALVRAQKQHKRAARHGFAGDSALADRQHIMHNLQQFLDGAQQSNEQKELCMGQLLHSLCGLADANGISAEQALADYANRFESRVAQQEETQG